MPASRSYGMDQDFYPWSPIVTRPILNLNAPGRVQTKKRRPALPMADWLRPWIETAEGHLVQYRGKPVKKIAGAFQSMRDAAGFGPDVTAYTVRHTIATELMARSVPELEIAALLGHSMPNIRTTGRYIHVAPARLASAKAGLDQPTARSSIRAPTSPVCAAARSGRDGAICRSFFGTRSARSIRARRWARSSLRPTPSTAWAIAPNGCGGWQRRSTSSLCRATPPAVTPTNFPAASASASASPARWR